VDKIGDPLVHMIRNSCDHGLEENEAARIAAGKSPEGLVSLRAFHKGGSIHIEVSDDGRGLDRDRIFAKGVERGVINEDDQLSDRDIYNLIMAPGFSTAKEVTDISGRGVGMDVVKRNIEALRGSIEITTEKGKGTTFTIRLPLTLAIIDGMVIRVGDERYVMPTLSILMSIQPKANEIHTALGKGEMLDFQGRHVPLYRLGRVFEVPEAVDDPTLGVVVVVEDEGKNYGLVCDEILGQQQIVIKPMGDALGPIKGIAGGAIMPNGSVGLIVDVGGAIKVAQTYRTATKGAKTLEGARS
ncbi:MAG: chemotaxis protein CheW, partial [Planctomycetes bacterium]|nr:chemotaxis protein CheW [Planctomycetota bacterium]